MKLTEPWLREIEEKQRARNAALVVKAKPSSGLVCLSTSDTSPVDQSVFELDTELLRLKRMKRRVCKAAELHQNAPQQGLRPAMVTLTYAREDEWDARHISESIKRCRQWLARRGHAFRYVWTAELQDRGVIHYHIVAWLPVSDVPPFWDAQGWWKHGSSRSEWAEKPVGYIASYVSKILSKTRLPHGARMHGSGGFTPEQRRQMAFHSRPSWIRMLSSLTQKIQRARGGGIVQTFACGLRRRIASPFVLLTRSQGRVVLALKASPLDIVRTQFQEIENQWIDRFQPA